MNLKIVAGVAGLAIAIGLAIPALASHEWESKASIPQAREGGCAGVVGNSIYLAYGLGPGGDSNTLFRYNISSDTWSDLTAATSPPGPQRSEGSEAVHGGKLYCIGGRAVGVGIPDLDRFDPGTGTWTSLASMPAGLAGTAAAVRGNAIYVFGGRSAGGGPCSGPAVDTIYHYDIDADAWTTAGTLNAARSDASAVQAGGKIYVLGGCDGGLNAGPFFDSVEVFDPNTGVSTTLTATLPVAVASAGAAAAGSEIHITGGLGSGNAHQVFSVPSHTFSLGTPQPSSCPALSPTRGEGDLLAHGGRLWAVGGSCPAYGAAVDDLDMLKLAP